MTIHDVKYLKENSEEDFVKYHKKISPLQKKIECDFLHQNVFCIYIQSVYTTSTTPCVLYVSANDMIMDSTMIPATGYYCKSEFEKKTQPIAKLTHVWFDVRDFNKNVIETFDDIYVTYIIRYHKPTVEMTNVYNDLNMEYNPHYIPDFSESESDDE
jgi:hypothetical protein